MERWAQNREDGIVSIARGLGIDSKIADPDQMIEQCKALHDNAFGMAVRRKGGTKILQQINRSLLKDFQLDNPSENAGDSSVLVLSGNNYDAYDSGHYLCWLSPITTELAEMHRSRQKSGDTNRVLFYSACRDLASRVSKTKEPFSVCLSHLVLQTLLWDDDWFSQCRQTVEDDLRDSNHKRTKTLKTLLAGSHGSREICIIIDRLDRIAPLADDNDLDDDEVSDLIESILEIISTASCKVRLVITVDTCGWPKVRDDADLEARWKIWKRRIKLEGYSLSYKIDWQQPELRTGNLLAAN